MARYDDYMASLKMEDSVSFSKNKASLTVEGGSISCCNFNIIGKCKGKSSSLNTRALVE